MYNFCHCLLILIKYINNINILTQGVCKFFLHRYWKCTIIQRCEDQIWENKNKHAAERSWKHFLQTVIILGLSIALICSVTEPVSHVLLEKTHWCSCRVKDNQTASLCFTLLQIHTGAHCCKIFWSFCVKELTSRTVGHTNTHAHANINISVPRMQPKNNEINGQSSERLLWASGRDVRGVCLVHWRQTTTPSDAETVKVKLKILPRKNSDSESHVNIIVLPRLFSHRI